MTKEIQFSPIVSPISDRKYGGDEGDSKYQYRFKSVVNGRIRLPYDGMVIRTVKPGVTGYLLVRHNINGEFYYSEYTNIPKLIVTVSDVLSSGQIIGYYLNNTDEITYLLRNSRMYRIPSEQFFNPKTSRNKDDDDKDKENDDKEKGDNDRNKSSNDDGSRTPKTDFMLLKPMMYGLNKGGNIADKITKNFNNAIKDTFSLKNKKKKKSNDSEDSDETVTEINKLHEQIQRIKKLL